MWRSNDTLRTRAARRPYSTASEMHHTMEDQLAWAEGTVVVGALPMPMASEFWRGFQSSQYRFMVRIDIQQAETRIFKLG